MRRADYPATHCELGGQFAQHPDVVTGFELRRGDQGDAAGLVQGVFELGQPIGRVDVDENEAGLCGGELGDHPFGVVRRPDADAVAALEPQRQQPCSKGVDPFFQLPVCPADLLMADNQCIALAKALDDPIEMHADRIADKRRATRAMNITQLRHLRRPLSAAALPSPTKPFGLGPASPALRERVASAARRVRVLTAAPFSPSVVCVRRTASEVNSASRPGHGSR